MRDVGRALAVILSLTLPLAKAAEAEAEWQPVASLAAGDRALAATVLGPMFGGRPDLWPDWLDPQAVMLPVGGGGSLLVVREPLHAPCGQFGFTFFGPVAEGGRRPQLGQMFCGGTLEVVPIAESALPDLRVTDGQERVDGSEGWRPLDLRSRWAVNQWLRILP